MQLLQTLNYILYIISNENNYGKQDTGLDNTDIFG
jgi:hypothetical protein